MLASSLFMAFALAMWPCFGSRASGDVPTVMASPVADSTQASSLAGVYKKRFTVKVHGESPAQHEVEDVVEIVRLDDEAIYVRAELSFDAGHSCSVYGVAHRQADGRFVYKKSMAKGMNATVAPCTLSVTTEKDRLLLSDRVGDIATCREWCGVRGSLAEWSIPLSQKRPIRYTARLLRSKEFASALKEAGRLVP